MSLHSQGPGVRCRAQQPELFSNVVSCAQQPGWLNNQAFNGSTIATDAFTASQLAAVRHSVVAKREPGARWSSLSSVLGVVPEGHDAGRLGSRLSGWQQGLRCSPTMIIGGECSSLFIAVFGQLPRTS